MLLCSCCYRNSRLFEDTNGSDLTQVNHAGYSGSNPGKMSSVSVPVNGQTDPDFVDEMKKAAGGSTLRRSKKPAEEGGSLTCVFDFGGSKPVIMNGPAEVRKVRNEGTFPPLPGIWHTVKF
jgi:hypothetical protein